MGYTGDGSTCIRHSQIQPSGAVSSVGCAGDICHPMAQCIDGPYRSMCICPNGWTGSGYGPSGCERTGLMDPCALNPCLNGGTCSPSAQGASFSCTCPPGTVRPLCALATDPCSNNPCQNGGTCTTVNTYRYRCSCPPKYTGMTCQSEVRACGGVLNGLTGTLKYPPSENYPHNSRCAWLIKTNVTQVLNVTITKFNLENSQDCRFDWLQVEFIIDLFRDIFIQIKLCSIV